MKKLSKLNIVRLKIALVLTAFTLIAILVSTTGHPRLFWFSLLSVIIIFVFNKNFRQNGEIYSNKNILAPYFLVYTSLMIYSLIVALNIYKQFGFSYEQFNFLGKSLLLILLILSLYCYKIKLSYFKWNITLKQFIIVLVLAIILLIALHSDQNASLKFISIYHYDIKSYGKYALSLMFFSAFFGELISRGVLMGGLKGIGLADEKIVLIQALLFAIPYYPAFMMQGCSFYLSIVLSSAQFILGYVLGRLYLKTKSLTPVIILHILINLI